MNNSRIARLYFEAFASKDVTRLESMLAENVVLRDWIVDLSGRTNVLAEMQKAFAAFDRIDVMPMTVHDCESTVIAELVIELDNERLKVVDILEFDAASRIVAIRAYKG